MAQNRLRLRVLPSLLPRQVELQNTGTEIQWRLVGDADWTDLAPTPVDGAAGEGVPVGGTTGQVLAKTTNADFDTEWVDQSGGGGSGTPELGDSIVQITTSGSHAVAAGTTAIVLNLGSPGSVDLTLPTVSAQAKTPLAISDAAGNCSGLTGAADAGDTFGVMGITGAANLGSSSGQGVGLALAMVLVPSTALSGWFQC